MQVWPEAVKPYEGRGARYETMKDHQDEMKMPFHERSRLITLLLGIFVALAFAWTGPVLAQDDEDEELDWGDEDEELDWGDEDEEEVAEDARHEQEGEEEEGEEEVEEQDEASGSEEGESGSEDSLGKTYLDDEGDDWEDEDEELEGEEDEGGGGPAGEDEEAQAAQTIARITDIYLTKQERRDPLERIIVDADRAEIWFLHPMRGDKAAVERVKCDAFRWLFFGRLMRSKGVHRVLEKLPEIQELRLSFFTIATRVQPDGRRGYKQSRKADSKMELTITRETVASLDLVSLKRKLQGPGCVAQGERVVDKKWYAEQEEGK